MPSFLSKTATMVKEAVISHGYLVINRVHNDMKIQKKTSVFRVLCNSYTLIDLSPVNYNVQVHASTFGNPYTIPINFTIGPRADDVDALRKYAVFLASLDNKSFRVRTVREFVESTIKCWTRSCASHMTMERVLTPELFMQSLRNSIHEHLMYYSITTGLNYDVDDLGDVEGHDQQGEEVPAMNEDVQPYDELEIDYYDRCVETKLYVGEPWTG